MKKEDIVEPDPRVIGPMLFDLAFAMEEAVIREMYAKLAAADMNRHTKPHAHPSFVEIIKQMTTIDTKVLKEHRRRPHGIFSVRLPQHPGFVDIGKVPTLKIAGLSEDDILLSTSNLVRLGLLRFDVRYPTSMDDEGPEVLKRFAPYQEALSADPKKKDAKLSLGNEGIFVTPIGTSFLQVCLP